MCDKKLFSIYMHENKERKSPCSDLSPSWKVPYIICFRVSPYPMMHFFTIEPVRRTAISGTNKTHFHGNLYSYDFLSISFSVIDAFVFYSRVFEE